MELTDIPEFPWSNLPEFRLPEDTPRICSYAQYFQEWVEPVCARLEQGPSIVAVNQAKVLLIDKYFEYRSYVPRSHRHHLSPNGHTCIYQVFVTAYDRLKVVEISLTPPMLFLPPAPAPAPTPPPPAQIAGIFIGEEEDQLGR